jgi:hypothetical protein
MHFIEYDDLTNDPNETMRKVYEFLEMDFYQHDFDNLKNVNQEKDAEIYGLKDMHAVREKVGKTSKEPKDILPASILELCNGAEFWRNVDINNVEESSDVEVADEQPTKGD